MVEDMAKNLVPAAEIGMTTAWVKTDVDWAAVARMPTTSTMW